MVGRRATAAAHDVEKPALRKLFDFAAHLVGRFVVFAHFVGQAGVRVGVDVAICNFRQRFQIRPHFAGAKRAVEADAKWLHVLHRNPERFHRLSAQGSPGSVGDGTGNHDRQVNAALVKKGFYSKNRRFGVQGIENRFHQQDVYPAVHQARRLVVVGVAQFIEGDGAEARVVHVRRKGGGSIGWPKRAGHVARFFWRFLGVFVGGAAGNLRGG